MSQQPTRLIDGFEFAAAGATQRGTIPLGSFARLRDLLESDAGEATYELHGVRDGLGRPSLRLHIRATLQLRCQRCLEALRLEVNTQSLLVLTASQEEIDADSAGAEAADRVLAGHEMPVATLVEDELILA